jgi:hypothetical protein
LDTPKGIHKELQKEDNLRLLSREHVSFKGNKICMLSTKRSESAVEAVERGWVIVLELARSSGRRGRKVPGPH